MPDDVNVTPVADAIEDAVVDLEIRGEKDDDADPVSVTDIVADWSDEPV